LHLVPSCFPSTGGSGGSVCRFPFPGFRALGLDPRAGQFPFAPPPLLNPTCWLNRFLPPPPTCSRLRSLGHWGPLFLFHLLLFFFFLFLGLPFGSFSLLVVKVGGVFPKGGRQFGPLFLVGLLGPVWVLLARRMAGVSPPRGGHDTFWHPFSFSPGF